MVLNVHACGTSNSGTTLSHTDAEHQNERDVKAFLVEPVVRELTKHLSNMKFQLPPPPPEEMQFVTTVNMEQPIKLHGGSRRPATTDFMMVVRSGGNILKFAAGEAKVDMQSDLFK